MKLWQIDGTLLLTLVGDGDAVQAVAFSHDGKTLASAGRRPHGQALGARRTAVAGEASDT